MGELGSALGEGGGQSPPPPPHTESQPACFQKNLKCNISNSSAYIIACLPLSLHGNLAEYVFCTHEPPKSHRLVACTTTMAAEEADWGVSEEEPVKICNICGEQGHNFPKKLRGSIREMFDDWPPCKKVKTREILKDERA